MLFVHTHVVLDVFCSDVFELLYDFNTFFVVGNLSLVEAYYLC